MQSQNSISKRFGVNTFPWDALIWITGLILMAVPDPEIVRSWSLCIFDVMGLDFCPGCGLGHAIAYLFRGELTHSFEAHPLGVPVAGVLIGHAIRLFYTVK